MKSKTNNIHKVTMLQTKKLIPHPANANVMNPTLLAKLKHHISKTHRYEPLVVRPHPTRPNHYELINGHHRKRVLEQLHIQKAACVIWNLSDDETLLLLATVNRLTGTDSPSKRLNLLEKLSEKLTIDDLASLLPEDDALLRAALERDDPIPITDPPAIEQMEESFTLFLKSEEKKRLVSALKKEAANPARALMSWVDRFESPTS